MTCLCNLLYCCRLSIIEMADERIQTAKESKCANRLKVFRLGSQSTPQSRSNSPPPFGAPESKFANRLKRVFRLGLQAQSRSNTQDEAAKLRAKYTHFRILIIGRANAGKTTLLKRVCNTREDPVYNRVSYQFRLMSLFSDRLTRLTRCQIPGLCEFL